MQAPWEQRPLYLFFTLCPGSGGMLGTKQTLWKYCWWLNEQACLLAFITCQALYQKLHLRYPTLSSQMIAGMDKVINMCVKEWAINEWGGKRRKGFQGQPLVHYPQHPDISLHCLASSNQVLFQGPCTAMCLPAYQWSHSPESNIHRHKQEQSKKLSVSHLKSSGSLHCFNRLRSQGWVWSEESCSLSEELFWSTQHRPLAASLQHGFRAQGREGWTYSLTHSPTNKPPAVEHLLCPE